MKKLLLVFGLFLFTVPSWATWTLVHSASNATCPGSGTSCAITVSSTGAGHVIVLWFYMPTAGAGTNSIASVSCGGTYTVDTGSLITVSALGGSQQMAYTLSSTSGVTTCTINTTAAMNSGGVAAMSEYSFTAGSVAFDISGNRNQAITTNPAGVTLTLSGTNDVIVQAVTPDASCSAIAAPFTNPDIFPGGWGYAGAINQSSGTGPTWTCGSGADMLSAVAIKEVTGGGTATPNHGQVF